MSNREPAAVTRSPVPASPSTYVQSIDGCTDAVIGQHGLTAAMLDSWLEPSRASSRCLARRRHYRPPAAADAAARHRRSRPRRRSPRQALPRRAHHRVLRHRRLRPRRPDARPDGRLEYSRRRLARAEEAPAHPLLRQPRRRDAGGRTGGSSISRPRASSSPPNPAAPPRRWRRPSPRSRPSRPPASKPASPSFSSASPSPQPPANPTACAPSSKVSRYRCSSITPASAAASPASPTSACCPPWPAASTRTLSAAARPTSSTP